MCKFSKIGVEKNRGGKSIIAVHANIYIQAKWLKIGNEKKSKASINTNYLQFMNPSHYPQLKKNKRILNLKV